MRLTLSVKLIALLAFSSLGALAAMAAVSLWVLHADQSQSAEELEAAISVTRASESRALVDRVTRELHWIDQTTLSASSSDPASPASPPTFSPRIFDDNQDWLAMGLVEEDSGKLAIRSEVLAPDLGSPEAPRAREILGALTQAFAAPLPETSVVPVRLGDEAALLVVPPAQGKGRRLFAMVPAPAVPVAVPAPTPWDAARLLAPWVGGLAALCLLLSLLWGWLAAKPVARSLQMATTAADALSFGNFKVRLAEQTLDEPGELAAAFNSMARGLQEREAQLATYRKFPNREMAERLLRGEVRLAGVRVEATFLSIDIRGFTALSETLRPEVVVATLNDYLDRMVRTIHEHDGVVDKIVGDQVLAFWGLPITRPDDTSRALRACLELRMQIHELNEKRRARGEGALRIGLGLNRGAVVAGNMGAEGALEYTVVGDARTFASRLDALTREYNTDLLVANPVFETAHQHFLFEPLPPVFIPGKSGQFQLYKVVGYVDEKGKPVRVEVPVTRAKKSA